MEKINPFAYLYYHLYLLQLEEYDLGFFIKIIKSTKGIPPERLRKKLIFTPKIVLLLVMTLGSIISLSIIFSPIFLLVLYVSFFPIIFALVLLTPLDLFLKKIRVQKAKKVLSKYPDLKVIGIAGSYGKTTMKEVLSTILAQKYQVVKTPENINTLLGIAELILKKVDEHTEILVVEMGEFNRGDIKEICTLVKPQIGIITGINEAHLVRMGSLENTVADIFELAQNMSKDGLLVVNDDDKLVHSNFKKFVTHQQMVLYSSKNNHNLKSGLLGRYASGVLSATAAVAKRLGLSDEQIKQGCALIKPLPHRLEPIVGAQGVLVIDDSYNGNPEGVKEAIYLLSTYTDRRKVYITPGLVEMGMHSPEVHREIGKKLSAVANLVVLIQNSATPFIAEGLIGGGFKKENIIWYESTERAHAAMGEIVKPNDVVLFQNDWPDNYT